MSASCATCAYADEHAWWQRFFSYVRLGDG